MSEEAAPKAQKPHEKLHEIGTKRYEVSIAKPNDPICYVFFYCTDTLKDAENKCIEMACDEERECIVWDNKGWGNPIVFRHKPIMEDKDVQTKPDEQPAKPKHKPKPKYRR